jgi:cobalt/nickel transport system permease protein
MHIPDGVLPIWLAFTGWVIAFAVLSFCLMKVKNLNLERKVPLIGILSALMVVGMTLEIVPIGYHPNLSVIAGIVLGPYLAFIAVFIVDLIVAMFGHGGITVVGLNSLIVGAEAVLGFCLFRVFWGGLNKSRLSAGLSSALATAVSLVLSSFLMVGLVYVSQVSPENIMHKKEQRSDDGILSQGPLGRHEESLEDKIDIERFAKTVFLLGVFGWTLESIITGLVIGYISRVRPDLILSGVT